MTSETSSPEDQREPSETSNPEDQMEPSGTSNPEDQMEPSGTSSREDQSEQLLYARVLEIGMLVGLLILFITFGLYVSRAVAPAVPLDQVSNYWSQGVHEYLEAVNHDFLHLEHPPTGWEWVALVGKGDFLNFLGIAILAGISIVCYLAIVPTLLRKRDTAYVTMALVEALVLILAASGILAVGH
jgi:hypothetical protein